MNEPTTLRRLASGTLVEVDAAGRASFLGCAWSVQVPTAALYPPEDEWYPESPEDLYTIVECGARVQALTDDPEGPWRCAGGHQFLGMEVELAPYGPEWQREQAERREAGAWA